MKRLLVLSESHHLSTGYANLARSLLPRLARDGRLAILELASGGHHGEAGVTWEYRPATPRPGHEDEAREFSSDPLNQFGAWKFEQTCLDFRPDIVWTMRDAWMDAHAFESPFRRFYRLVAQTPVDAEPQHEEWLDQFNLADELYTYTRWGENSLKKQSPGLPLKGCVPLGVDTNVFSPLPNLQSSLAHRESVGLDGEALIVGTVMRNMVRKLYPDLIEIFAKTLIESPPEISRRLYLYIHACWPDSGWDLPRLIRQFGVSSRVLFTYVCGACGSIYPSFFAGALSACRRCGNMSARLPHPLKGIPHEKLASIYRLFDIYVQMACAEGFGLSQVEAGACGVPGVCMDYAGMADMVETLGFIPVPIRGFWTERETSRKMAVPDRDEGVKAILGILRLPASSRFALGRKAHRGVLENYSWDDIAGKWADIFVSQPAALPWNSPRKDFSFSGSVPDGLSDEQFVEWGMVNILKRPELVGSKKASGWVRDLGWEATFRAGWHSPRGYTRQDALAEWQGMANKFAHWENHRAAALCR